MNARRAGLLAAAMVLVSALAACASSTKAVRNETLAKEGFKTYREVYLVPPLQDPRDVMPKVIAEFKAMGMNVTVTEAAKLQGRQGTGFVISTAGHVVTCAHVLKDVTAATLWIDGKRYEADILDKDDERDLAVLKLRGAQSATLVPLSFSSDTRYAIGRDVFTIGFPLSGVLGTGPRYTRGALSATSGLKDDARQLQFSAQIQPGSSGGPLFDKDGAVVGVVQQTLNAIKMLEQTGGALPQDVNFAIKGQVVLEYLQRTQSEVYGALEFNKGRGVEELQRSVAKVRGGIVDEDADKVPRLVARVDYASRWDIWYRFRFFIVRLWDYQSGEILVAAGQNRDNMVSNEDVVIRDTFAEVRKALAPK